MTRTRITETGAQHTDGAGPLRVTGFRLGLLALTFGAGCTTLGPMPTVSGQSVMLEARPRVEAQAAVMPGYYLSSAVEEKPTSSPIGQLALMFDPNELVGVPGLGIGGRVITDGSPYAEPMLRYRTSLDDEERVSVGGVAHGMMVSDEGGGASLEAWRFGGEIGADFRVTPKSEYVELHLQGGFALLGLDASGKYCKGQDGYGVDCGEDVANARASVSGIYPTLFAGLSLDAVRISDSLFHGLRFAILVAGGQMPRVVDAKQEGAVGYFSGGASLTLMFGGE
ncbi:MAG: hypothetical protein KIT72_01115 [Polyangiaceae bacterium]|nr:hypothetical protein [Polyangiaceae bacterium]MCW5788995.1 hypothetical protein [Polyangiaceae bacterium]